MCNFENSLSPPLIFSAGQNTTGKSTGPNHPPPSFIYGRPPFRAATTPRRSPPHQRTQRTRFVAAWRSWAARGRSSGRFAVVAPCFCTIWGGKIETNNQLVWGVFERLRWASFILEYRREPSASSETAEKRSNCYMLYGVLIYTWIWVYWHG